MGITKFSLSLLEKYSSGVKNVCELGAQNLYIDRFDNPPYASDWYRGKGIEYACIDLSGENGALLINLEEPQTFTGVYDMVTDFGTGEHVRDGYNLAKIVHDLVKPGGIVIQENPKSGNWPKHGFNYKTKEFYQKLAELNGYEILEIGEVAAMGNEIDGWNVYCVFRKVSDTKFISKAKFKECGLKSE